MSNPTIQSFPTNVTLPRRIVAYLDQIQDPLALLKSIDRFLGFVSWDFSTKLSSVKLTAVIIMYGYLLLSCVCAVGLVNPEDIHPDNYLKMWFFIGAGVSCSLPWIIMVPKRSQFEQIFTFLTDLHRQDPHHPLRVRSRPVILLCSGFFFAMNTSISVFWAILLYGSCPMVFAFYEQHVVKQVSSVVYPVECFHLGMTANVTMVMVLTCLLLFCVEFSILGMELSEAFGTLQLEEIRRCIQRHQRLLEMVTLFRDRIKSYFLIAMGLYFFLVTYSSFLLVVQLREGDFPAVRFNVFNVAISIVTIILYGVICDSLEDRVKEVGSYVYNSNWPTKLVCVGGSMDTYRLQKKSLLMIMARSQKKVGFTCGDIYQMSTITSMQALKMCYTAFTVLWNTKNE